MLIREFKRVEDVLFEALKFINVNVSIREIDVRYAVNYILAEDIYSPINLPYVNKSVVDGYAVRSIDTYSASPSNPVILEVKGFIDVGQDVSNLELRSGEAYEVCTGSPLPKGCDAVVMYEDVNVKGKYIEVLRAVTPYTNISRIGEDVKKGELILRKGTRLKPWDIALLIALGIKKVKVYEPKVALICIGNELIDIEDVENVEDTYSKGKVINTNRYLIENLLKNEFNCLVDYLGTIPDDSELIKSKVRYALDNYDFVITTGGISVGKRDLTFKAILELNPEFTCRGLSIRPGRPTGLAIKNGKPIFMLSGFPVAAYIGFEVLVKPIISHVLNVHEVPHIVKGTLRRRVTSIPNVKSYVRVNVCVDSQGKIWVEPLAITGSGLISTLTRSNGMLIIPEDREGFDEGEEVEVILTRNTLPNCT